MTNDYHFITHWRVKGSTAEIYDIISEPMEYPRWWPSVYLQTKEIEPGDEHGVGGEFCCIPKDGFPTRFAGSHPRLRRIVRTVWLSELKAILMDAVSGRWNKMATS